MVAFTKSGSLGSVPYAKLLTSAADGTFSGSFPAGMFTSPPVMTAVAVAPGGRDYVVTIFTKTSTGFTGQVRSSRALPAVIGLLSVLAGYDTFAPAPGVMVDVMARSQT